MHLPVRSGLTRLAHGLICLTLLALAACGGSSHPGTSAPTLQSVQVTPTNPSIAAGTSTQLAATALYSDGSHTDVTTQASWSSSSPSNATVGASSGHATALVAGTTTITATLQGISGTTTLTVTAATLVSLEVSPALPQVAAGSTQAFKATGTFSDQTTQDLTADMSWSSSVTTVATIDASGLATTLVAGQTVITANCMVASTCGSVSGNTTLTVTAATLVSISVTPASPSIALGTTQQFVATGSYSDGSTQNLTTQATWNSDTPATATISSTSGSQGLATSVATGSTHISAMFGGISSAPVVLQVTAATLVSIAVTPVTPTLSLGTTLQLTATGTYSDNSTQDLTSQVSLELGHAEQRDGQNAPGSRGS